MGEAKRRKLAGNYPLSNRAASGHGHARERLSPSASSVASLPHIPDDLRADIAQSVRGIEFRGFGGGTCFFRATIGTGIVLLRTRPLAPEDEIRMRDQLHEMSRAEQKSINEVWVEMVKEHGLDRLQPHELLAMIRDIPEAKRKAFIDSLPPHKRPKLSE
jgi:hypothetical protein